MIIYLIQLSSLISAKTDTIRKVTTKSSQSSTNYNQPSLQMNVNKDLTTQSIDYNVNYDKQLANYDYGDPNDCIDEDELMACVQVCENQLINEECRREAYLMQCYGQCTKGIRRLRIEVSNWNWIN